MVRRMSMTVISASIKIVIAVLILIGLFYVAGKGFEFGESLFSPIAVEEAPGTDISITIAGGTDGKEAGELLEEKGLIKDSLVFYVQSLLYGYDIADGTYELNTSMTSEEILQIIGYEKEEE